VVRVRCAGQHGAHRRQGGQVAAAPGEPCPQVAAHHLVDPRRVRALLDAVARPVARHRVLRGRRRRRRVVRRPGRPLRPLVLALLPQQPHQPVLLRARQRPVQEGVRAHPASRLAAWMTDCNSWPFIRRYNILWRVFFLWHFNPPRPHKDATCLH